VTTRRRRPLALALALIVTAAILAAGAVLVTRHTKTSSVPSPSPPQRASPPRSGTGAPSTAGAFSVSTTTILEGGEPYRPYGVTIFGLARPQWESGQSDDLQQIAAISGFWKGNSVRIQVAPPLLASQGSSYQSAIQREVSTARADGLNVIISAQYERVGKLRGPDASTVAFWRTIAPLYAGDSHVWFDLFNEPVETSDPRSTAEPSASSWDIWRDGGHGFVGMQTLVDDIRSVDPSNLIVAEGLAGGKTLDGISGHLLTGGSIVYSVHPYFSPTNRTPGQWDANFGDLSSTIPILLGEWGEYQTTRESCVENAPTLVPEFLSYVTAHHFGLIAWALDPGNMIRGTDLEAPTQFDPGVPYQCVPTSPGPAAQGAGASIHELFTSAP